MGGGWWALHAAAGLGASAASRPAPCLPPSPSQHPTSPVSVGRRRRAAVQLLAVGWGERPWQSACVGVAATWWLWPAAKWFSCRIHSGAGPLGWFGIGIETLGAKQTQALFPCLLEVEGTCPARVLLLPQPSGGKTTLLIQAPVLPVWRSRSLPFSVDYMGNQSGSLG